MTERVIDSFMMKICSAAAMKTRISQVRSSVSVTACPASPRVRRAADLTVRYPLTCADAFALAPAAELKLPLATGDPKLKRPAGDAHEGLGNRADVHDRVRSERPRALPVGEAISLHPHDLPVDDHGGGESHDPRIGHLTRDETVEGRIRGERR